MFGCGMNSLKGVTVTYSVRIYCVNSRIPEVKTCHVHMCTRLHISNRCSKSNIRYSSVCIDSSF